MKTFYTAFLLIVLCIAVLVWQQDRLSLARAENRRLTAEYQNIKNQKVERNLLNTNHSDTKALQQLRELQRARQNQRLELMRLRSQVTLARNKTEAAATLQERAKAQKKSVQERLWQAVPAESVTNVVIHQGWTTNDVQYIGAETPFSAAESYLWAALNSDLDAWQDLRISAALREGYGNNIEMAERQVADEHIPFEDASKITMDRIEMHGEDQALAFFLITKQGSPVPTYGNLQLKRVDDGWKVIMASIRTEK